MSKNNGAAQQEQTALNNQQSINSQITGYANQQGSLNNQYYQPLLSGLSQANSSSIAPASQTLNQGLSTLADNNGNMSNTTGVNQNALGQGLVNYDTNTGATNLSQASPALDNFYSGEMQNGLNPLIAQNAQSQLSQQSAQGMNTAMNNAAPGQNMNALAQANQNSLLQNSTNLAGNLAGQGQAAMQQGAQGLASTAQNQDTQTQQMLVQALSAGSGLNQQALTSLLQSMEAGSSALNQSNQFMQQGNTNQQNAMSPLSGLSNQYAGQATQFGQQAAQQPGLGSLLGGALGAFSGLGGLSGIGDMFNANPSGNNGTGMSSDQLYGLLG